jgi:carboxylesterase type B
VASAVEIVGDGVFACGADLIAKLRHDSQQQQQQLLLLAPAGAPPPPVYVYRYDYRSLTMDYCDPLRLLLGVYHTAELPFVFNQTGAGLEWAKNCTGFGPQQAQVVLAMHRRWAAFARTGVPDLEDAAAGGGDGEAEAEEATAALKWPRYVPASSPHLLFEHQPRVERNYKREKCTWWDEFLLSSGAAV